MSIGTSSNGMQGSLKLGFLHVRIYVYECVCSRILTVLGNKRAID